MLPEAEAQEVEPVVYVGDDGLLLGQLQPPPRSARNGIRSCLTSSATSLVGEVTMKSSAYLTRLTLEFLPKCPFSNGSIPFRVMFAKVGDMAPPCGIPSSVGTATR